MERRGGKRHIFLFLASSLTAIVTWWSFIHDRISWLFSAFCDFHDLGSTAAKSSPKCRGRGWNFAYERGRFYPDCKPGHISELPLASFSKRVLVLNSHIWKLVFIHVQMKTNFHMKGWTPGLALKKRPKVIRKWPGCTATTISHKMSRHTLTRVCDKGYRE